MLVGHWEWETKHRGSQKLAEHYLGDGCVVGELFPLLQISYIVWQMGDVFFTMQQDSCPASDSGGWKAQVLRRQRQDSGFLVGRFQGYRTRPSLWRIWFNFNGATFLLSLGKLLSPAVPFGRLLLPTRLLSVRSTRQQCLSSTVGLCVHSWVLWVLRELFVALA